MRENEKLEGLLKVKRSGALEVTTAEETNQIQLRGTIEKKEKQRIQNWKNTSSTFHLTSEAQMMPDFSDPELYSKIQLAYP